PFRDCATAARAGRVLGARRAAKHFVIRYLLAVFGRPPVCDTDVNIPRYTPRGDNGQSGTAYDEKACNDVAAPLQRLDFGKRPARRGLGYSDVPALCGNR